MKRITMLLGVGILFLCSMLYAAVPQLINFQGVLKDGSGNPVADGSYSVQFTIYDAPSAGNIKWQETQSVNTVNGLFTVLLGSLTPVLDSVFNDSSRYLGIKVGADPEMTPRQKLSSVGYSHNSSEWTSAGPNLFRLNGIVGIGALPSPGSKLYVETGGSGLQIGVQSYSNASSNSLSAGILGTGNNASTGNAAGGFFNGTSTGGLGYGVYGSGDDYGVYGTSSTSSSTPLYGCFGEAYNSSNGTSYGGYFYGSSFGTSYGIRAEAGTYGVYGVGIGSTGVYGDGSTYGVYGTSSTYGVVGVGGNRGVTGLGGLHGVYGDGNIGVKGVANISGGYGIHGDDGGFASALSGRFDGHVQIIGDLVVTGAINKGALGFKIDHPLDPTNKYLHHSGVESPDMMNIYNGNITLDGKGEATVQLPDWFGAVNKDFRYQLTCIGGFAPVYVAEKIKINRFRIAGGTPGLEVSWQVTGIRKDAYAEAHRIPVEEEKSGKEKGKYLHPAEHGAPASLGMHYEEQQKMAAERKQMQEQQAKMEAERKRHEDDRAKMEQERVIQEQKIKENQPNK